MMIYLDCNATTPIEPRVSELVMRFMDVEFGNAVSRTHGFGMRAKLAVAQARDHVAALAHAGADEVVFTSGATESNNLAILGLRAEGEKTGKKHIISSLIEHKAVLEPLEWLVREAGFEVTLLEPTSEGIVPAAALREALREDTLLVSLMHVNNETGMIQPLSEYVKVLESAAAYLHVDGAQGFGKVEGLEDARIDMISISGHKLYAPKGIGALIVRRRGWDRVPLTPLVFGGGQESGLRPGTLPVHLIVGLGEAARIAKLEREPRAQLCAKLRVAILADLSCLNPIYHGCPEQQLPSTLNLSIPGVDAEAAIVALKTVAAVSNGSACTSHSYQPSHVLQAMGLHPDSIAGALRLSWCHMTEEFEAGTISKSLATLIPSNTRTT